MNKTKIKETVINKIQKLVPKESIKLHSRLIDLSIDSLDVVELITEAEDELDIQVTDEALASVKTVDDVISIFEDALEEKK